MNSFTFRALAEIISVPVGSMAGWLGDCLPSAELLGGQVDRRLHYWANR